MIAMIPFNNSVGSNSRVPPIYSINKYPILPNNTSGNDSSNPIPQFSTTSRRGRRSAIPPEIREQTRRIKKQNMERKRRACISDKINALHNLAMNLIGVDSHEYHKVEKADILNLCHSVFRGIANIVKDDPELQLRLRKLRDNLNETSSTSTLPSLASTSSVGIKDDSIKSIEKMKLDQQEDKPLYQYPQNVVYYHQNQNVSSSSKVSILPSSSLSSVYSPSNSIEYQQYNNTDDKENLKIPKLTVRNVSSYTKYIPVTTPAPLPPPSTIPTSCMNSDTSHWTLSPPLSSVIQSTPLNNLQLNHLIHLQERKRQYESTPIQQQPTKVFNSPINYYSRDSGFDSMQSVEMTPTNIKQMFTLNEDDTSPIRLMNHNSLFKETSNISMPFSSSTTPSTSSENYQSVLSTPELNRLPVFDMIKKLKDTPLSLSSSDDSTAASTTDICSSIVVTHSNPVGCTSDPSVKPMWRPYLD
ncbi:unnamed protein product [Trichobilharzia regenti]|uniref:BHLH domain-containing protein n=1 Tax=Trichobilharzia regenti TaxID=157069 RepID=A0A183VND6_TRIRE|nr:unnamed protein product [Trichobilharzia regenti]VDP97871.1 unnamed protein product [Trichobilharzia regenti]